MKKIRKQIRLLSLSLFMVLSLVASNGMKVAAEEEFPEETIEAIEEAPQEEAVEEEVTAESEEEVPVQEEVVQEEAQEEETVEEEATTSEEEVVEEEKTEQPKAVSVAFDQSTTVNGVNVRVSAEAGVFPEGAKLSVKAVNKNDQKKVDAAINAVRNDDTNVVSSYTFDIKVLDKDGKEVQPADKKKVNVSFKTAEVRNANLDAQVYHIADKGTITAKSVEELSVKTSGETASVQTKSFSYYTVEFTYNNLQYVLEGGESVDLNTVLKAIGLSGTVSKVEVSDKTLFSVEKTADKWVINSYKAFSTNEWMKVTIDGVVYEIVVTDAQAPSNITAMTDIPNGQTWDNDFTLSNNGGFAAARAGTGTVSGSNIISTSTTTAQLILARVNGTMNLNGITFTQNNAAPVFTTFNGGKINITDSTFTGPGDNGGKGLFTMTNDAGRINLSGDNTFENYKNATVTHNDGVITVTDGTTTFKDSDLSTGRGNAKIVIEEGAELVLDETHLKSFWIENNGTLTITNRSDIDSCVIVNKNSTLTFEESKIHNYSGSGNPSGQGYITMISGSNVELTMKKTEIYDNVIRRAAATPDGVPGASIISLQDSTVIMDEVDAHDNSSQASGGVMHAVDTEIMIKNSTFTNNSANTSRTSPWYGRGGAIFVEDDHIFVETSTFEGNKATEGGAIYVVSHDEDPMKSVINIIDSDFIGNEAKRAGGALYERGNGTTSNILGVNFIDNVAGVRGGAFVVQTDDDPNGTFIGKSTTSPTIFDGNKVNNVGSPWTTDEAGGALFIREAHVRMNNVAVYDNEAPHAGGGISSCNIGAVEVGTVHGAAIFNNNVLNEHRLVPEGDDLKDVYFYNIDPDKVTDSNFNKYPYELYEKMFNGGFHNWDRVEKTFDQGLYLVAQSNPTNTDTSNAEVIFRNNKVLIDESRYTNGSTVSGGAIASNGLLTIGTGTELKVVKLWDDNNDNDRYRPSPEDEIDWLIIKQDGQVIDQEQYGVTYKVVTGGDADQYILDNNVAVVDYDGQVVKFADKYSEFGNNAWLIIIDGSFPRYKENASGHTIDELYEYTVEEDLSKLQAYINTKSEGNEDTYFELTNKHEEDLVSVKVTKDWLDGDNEDGIRPSEITVNLLADGEMIQSATVKEAAGWTYTFTDLKKYKDGVEIVYTIDEEPIEGYDLISIEEIGTDNPDEKEFTILNGHEVEEKGGTIYIYKVDSVGNTLAGAKFNILDEAGNVVDSFTSNEGPHRLALPFGVYTVEEVEAPVGFVAIKPFTFELVNADGVIELIDTAGNSIVVQGSDVFITNYEEKKEEEKKEDKKKDSGKKVPNTSDDTNLGLHFSFLVAALGVALYTRNKLKVSK